MRPNTDADAWMGDAIIASRLRTGLLMYACRAAALTLLVVTIAATSGCGRSADAASAYHDGDFERSLELYEARAAEGDLDALNLVGIHYYLGLGVAHDFERAAVAFEQAALANHARAQRNLGILYMNGLGVPQNNQRAYGWFFQAHSGGSRGARAYIKFLSDNVTPNAGQQARAWVEEQLRTHANGDATGEADTP